MKSPFQQSIAKVTAGQPLDEEEAARAFQIIMHGGATPAQMGALLAAMRVRGETVDEICGAVRAMRASMKPFKVNEDMLSRAIDTCGTGGDGLGLPNISTAAGIVIAGAGVPVIKHGNKAVSSKAGSADVLGTLGVQLDATSEQMLAALEAGNFCFLMAPLYHAAMRHVAPVRQELGVRTIFNLLGPLCNPAGVKHQLLGVFSDAWLLPIAEVLQRLGTQKAWVVHGEDGADEISLTHNTHVVEVTPEGLREFVINPEELGIEVEGNMKGGNAFENAKLINDLLVGTRNDFRQAVLLNAAAGLVITGNAADMAEGMQSAAKSIDSGKAREALDEFIRHTQPEAA